MNKGAVLIARNNLQVDYVKQAYFLAKRIRKHLDLPTTIITDNVEYLKKTYADSKTVFDHIIEIPSVSNYHYRNYKDGLHYRSNLEFKNTSRCDVFELSPYDQTLLMDTDFIVNNAELKFAFEQNKNLLLYDNAIDLAGWRDTDEFKYISPTGIKFYWATVVYFKKTTETKYFFDLVKHIQSNWLHYKSVYQIKNITFRNDFAFSIAAHILGGFVTNNVVGKMPGTMYYTIDKDLCYSIEDNVFKFLVENTNSSSYFPVIVKDSNVHIMNKFSLNRVIDES